MPLVLFPKDQEVASTPELYQEIYETCGVNGGLEILSSDEVTTTWEISEDASKPVARCVARFLPAIFEDQNRIIAKVRESAQGEIASLQAQLSALGEEMTRLKAELDLKEIAILELESAGVSVQEKLNQVLDEKKLLADKYVGMKASYDRLDRAKRDLEAKPPEVRYEYLPCVPTVYTIEVPVIREVQVPAPATRRDNWGYGGHG